MCATCGCGKKAMPGMKAKKAAVKKSAAMPKASMKKMGKKK
jgi:hypothetical protein